tara:strand:+ start:2519 stop:2806 length:288 start_codon:yes stop_codon:yes gene_type:complete
VIIFIAAVSAFDSYMTVVVGPALGPIELNPLAKYLIDLNGGGVALLIGLKTFGTAMALLICHYLYICKYKFLNVVMWMMVLVQLIVMASYVPYFM